MDVRNPANYKLGRAVFAVGWGRLGEFRSRETISACGRSGAPAVARDGVNEGVTKGRGKQAGVLWQEFARTRLTLSRMPQRLPSWRYRAADEFREQEGGRAKAWWVARFGAAVMTLGNFDFGIAALGNGDAQFNRAVRQAAQLTRAKRKMRR
jgi:hypothetical protein